MKKTCHVCGNTMDMDATFCAACGTHFPAEEYIKPKKNKLLTILIVLLTAVMVGILVFTLVYAIMGGNYVTAVSDAQKLLAGDKDALEDMVPAKVWDQYAEEETHFLGDMLDEADERYDDYISDLERNYGSDPSLKLVVTKAKKSSASKVKSIASNLNEYCNVKKDSVTQSFLLESYISVSGEDDSITEDLENLYAVKIDDKWYLLFYQAEEEPVFFAIWAYNRM